MPEVGQSWQNASDELVASVDLDGVTTLAVTRINVAYGRTEHRPYGRTERYDAQFVINTGGPTLTIVVSHDYLEALNWDHTIRIGN